MFNNESYGNIVSMHLAKFSRSEKGQNNKDLILISLRKTYSS